MSDFALSRIICLAASLSIAAAGAPAFAAPGVGEAVGRLAASPQAVQPEQRARPMQPADDQAERPLQLAQANCSGAAAQAAAQTGGEVLSVSSREQDGRVVCVVTVLIPGQGGDRPRRTTITIPG